MTVDGTKIPYLHVPSAYERQIKVLFLPETTGTKDAALLVAIMIPGHSNGPRHHHVHEFMYVAWGNGRCTIGKQTFTVSTETALHASREVVHELVNTEARTRGSSASLYLHPNRTALREGR